MADEREHDPRRGTDSDEEYLRADPREIVEESDLAMSGPAGAPQEEESAQQRRSRDRDERRSS